VFLGELLAKGAKKLGMRLGNWLTVEEARSLWQLPNMHTVKGKRDRAMLAVFLGCGLRRRELIGLTCDHIQRREDHWAIVDLVGKGGHIRAVPMPDWVKQTIDDWLTVGDKAHGKIFRCVCRKGVVWRTEITEKVVWHVVKEYARRLGVSKLALHDLRRSCARLCHDSGGELEQIQFLLGHVSVQTTEKYLGCKQRLRGAVNDRIGIEPASRSLSLRSFARHSWVGYRSLVSSARISAGRTVQISFLVSAGRALALRQLRTLGTL
jgi:site-specific recombinase XerD